MTTYYSCLETLFMYTEYRDQLREMKTAKEVRAFVDEALDEFTYWLRHSYPLIDAMGVNAVLGEDWQWVERLNDPKVLRSGREAWSLKNDMPFRFDKKN